MILIHYMVHDLRWKLALPGLFFAFLLSPVANVEMISRHRRWLEPLRQHQKRHQEGDLFALLSQASADALDGYAVDADEQIVLSEAELCRNFSHVDPQRMSFTTPFFPHQYPPNLHCIRIINAPSKDYVVQVEFRGSLFEVEADNQGGCTYDFVEFRNGQYGFSPLIGRYCGDRFPPRIIATSGSVWIHFRTDSNLQYAGFKAVYSFVPAAKTSLSAARYPNAVDCKMLMSANDGVISSTYMHDFYRDFYNRTGADEIECVWRIQTSSEFHLRILFDKFSLASPNECSMNFLEIYRANTAITERLKKLCGLTATTIIVHSNVAIVRIFLKSKTLLKTKIDAVYSAFVDIKNCTDSDFFNCGDETCVPNDLVCNERMNCVTGKDEAHCDPEVPTLHFNTGPYLVILVVIIGLIVCIVTCAVVFNFCPHFKRRMLEQSLPEIEARRHTMSSSDLAVSRLRTITANNVSSANCVGVTYAPPEEKPTSADSDTDRSQFLELLRHSSAEDLAVFFYKPTPSGLANMHLLSKRMATPPPPPRRWPAEVNGPIYRPPPDLETTEDESTFSCPPPVEQGGMFLLPPGRSGRKRASPTPVRPAANGTVVGAALPPLSLDEATGRRAPAELSEPAQLPTHVSTLTFAVPARRELTTPFEDEMRKLSAEKLNRVGSDRSSDSGECFVLTL